MRKVNMNGFKGTVASVAEIKKVLTKIKEIEPFKEELIIFEKAKSEQECGNLINPAHNFTNNFTAEFLRNGMHERPDIKLLFGMASRIINFYFCFGTRNDLEEIVLTADAGRYYDSIEEYCLLSLSYVNWKNIFPMVLTDIQNPGADHSLN